ncbi:MAG: C-GCAxxG-C-C family protein [Coriobacteriia bacterium]|nr:C-GCAxxG-C-C family protein [Coriobacteriia bacterium]
MSDDNALQQRIDELVSAAIERYLHDGRHCSEMTFVTPCRCFDPAFDADLIRIANPFGGGIAERDDLCGAVVGGCMAIGYFFGRRDEDQDQERSWRLAREYYDWFKAEMGFLYCRDKTTCAHNWDLHQGCAPVVEFAMRHVIEVLTEEGA